MIQRISTLDHPELEPYRTLRRPLEHQMRGIFVAEGEKVVRRLLETNLQVVSILLTPMSLEKLSLPEEKRIRVYVCEKNLMEQIVGYRLHQGVMAVAKIPGEKALDQILTEAPEDYLLVALDGIASAENVGLIVRNCAALNVDAIIVGENSSDPFLRRAVRNSMGGIFQIPALRSAHLADTLTELRSNGTKIVAADPSGDIAIDESNLTGKLCIVFGNEGSGISASVLEVCSSKVRIPMHRQTDSLNVANASAVFLYEASRQRFQKA
jgi:tRNA G18 (ribose-2'-O)-methylase SpoU